MKHWNIHSGHCWQSIWVTRHVTKGHFIALVNKEDSNMIVYFHWNGLILNIRFYFQYFFLNSEIYFCRSFIIFTSLVLIRGVTNTRIAQLYSGFGPCRFWALKCWRMPNAPGFWHSLVNRQTSGESVSLPQYLGCNTVFDMRLRVTFLRRKTVSLQSNIAHRE